MTTTMPTSLTGRDILVLEDEYFIVEDMVRAFEASGASVIGPVASVDEALHLIQATGHLDGAVLDINLRGEMAYPVADALIERGVPFVFATGYDEATIPPRYAHVTRCEKPVDINAIARALFG